MDEIISPLRAQFQQRMREYVGALAFKYTSLTWAASTTIQVLPANPLRHSITWGPYNGSTIYVAPVSSIGSSTSGAFYLGTTFPFTWSITVEGVMVCSAWWAFGFTTTPFLGIVEGLVLP